MLHNRNPPRSRYFEGDFLFASFGFVGLSPGARDEPVSADFHGLWDGAESYSAPESGWTVGTSRAGRDDGSGFLQGYQIVVHAFFILLLAIFEQVTIFTFYIIDIDVM